MRPDGDGGTQDVQRQVVQRPNLWPFKPVGPVGFGSLRPNKSGEKNN